jgi:hypothetical protein
MIALSGELVEVKYGRAYVDVSGRLVGIPLDRTQERQLAARVGKRFVVTVAEDVGEESDWVVADVEVGS